MFERKNYVFGKTCVQYTIMKDTKKVFLQLLPTDCEEPVTEHYERYEIDGQFDDHVDWYAGALAQIQLAHHSRSPYSNCCKLGQGYKELYFKEQHCKEEADQTVIETTMTSEYGYEVIHRLTHREGEEGFVVETIFCNTGDQDLTLEMITSAELDGLTPYSDTEHSEELKIHVFKSGWSTEGKHMAYSLAELNLEKSWGGNYSNYQIGTKGARATQDYFPYAAVEDTKRHVLWGITLLHNTTWQMDFSRYGRDISFSAGLGDTYYGNWSKVVKSKETFAAPAAYIAAVKGDIADLSDVMLRMRERTIANRPEEGMPIVFNEWCTTWGNPTHEGNLQIAKKLQDTKVKYFVMDAGWYPSKTTEDNWVADPEKFPNGLKAYTDELRSMGYIPGIWMEFEGTKSESAYFAPKYDDMHLTCKGHLLAGQVGLAGVETVWDFRNPKTVAFLQEKVIRFLKDNGFGYLKIDYNCNIGSACDGEEAPGEEFRKYMQSVADFVSLMKKEMPELVIENCSSGGMRLDPVMTGNTSMSSFSDAHVCEEFPIVAANLQYLLPPCQSQIWCVLHPEYDSSRFAYTISAGFLGRICWSGNIMGLSEAQMQEIRRAEDFYTEVCGIIRHGKSIIARTEELINFRHPKGTQAVLRYADDGEHALLVYHTFQQPQQLTLALNGNWQVEKTLYEANIAVEDGALRICEENEIFGNVVLLKKRYNALQ